MGLGEGPSETLLERERERPADYAYRAGHAWYLAREGRDDEAARTSPGSRPTTGPASATT